MTADEATRLLLPELDDLPVDVQRRIERNPAFGAAAEAAAGHVNALQVVFRALVEDYRARSR